MSITLTELPYKQDALEPYISSKTLDFHYGKHHQAYVKKLNELVKGTNMAGETIENLVQSTVKNPDQMSIFNSAAQVWNHTFY